jgi:hypothetical protein
MSAIPHIEPAESAAKPRWSGREIAAFFVASVVASAYNLYLAFELVPRFAAILHDMLPPNRPLPTPAAIVLGGKWVFVALACAWLVVAWVIPRSRWARPNITLFTVLGFAMVEVIGTAAALLIPLVEIMRRLGGAPLH